jgi:hypothetical protein
LAGFARVGCARFGFAFVTLFALVTLFVFDDALFALAMLFAPVDFFAVLVGFFVVAARRVRDGAFFALRVVGLAPPSRLRASASTVLTYASERL